MIDAGALRPNPGAPSAEVPGRAVSLWGPPPFAVGAVGGASGERGHSGEAVPSRPHGEGHVPVRRTVDEVATVRAQRSQLGRSPGARHLAVAPHRLGADPFGRSGTATASVDGRWSARSSAGRLTTLSCHGPSSSSRHAHRGVTGLAPPGGTTLPRPGGCSDGGDRCGWLAVAAAGRDALLRASGYIAGHFIPEPLLLAVHVRYAGDAVAYNCSQVGNLRSLLHRAVGLAACAPALLIGWHLLRRFGRGVGSGRCIRLPAHPVRGRSRLGTLVGTHHPQHARRRALALRRPAAAAVGLGRTWDAPGVGGGRGRERPVPPVGPTAGLSAEWYWDFVSPVVT